MANILITAPVFLLFVLIAVRSLEDMGLPVSLPAPLCAGETAHHDGPLTVPRRETVKVFLFSFGLRLAVLGALFVCAMLASDGEGGIDVFFQKLRRWDARHYVNLVEQGYSGYVEDGQHLFLVFYPLYVWVVRLVRLVVPNTVLAGLLVSIIGYSVGCCFVHKLAALRYSSQVAGDAVLFLSLFPFSFFFSTVMTEGLFLCTTAAAVYYALRHKWLLFGVFGALSAANRMVGILVIAPAVIELLTELKPLETPVGKSLKRGLLEFLKRLPLLLMPLLGTGSYLLLNWYVDGDPLAFLGHQVHWHQGGMWFSQVLTYIWGYLSRNIWQSTGWAVWAPELLMFVGFFVVLVLASRRRENPPALLAYGFCYLIANYSLSWLLSAGRYLSCGFALFIFMAQLTEDRPYVRRLLLAVEAVFMGVYLFGYVNGAQIM